MSTMNPSSVTVHYDDPEVDPSSWERALAWPDGAFLVVTDLAKEPRPTYLIPAERISSVTVIEIATPPAKLQPMIVSNV